MIEQTNHNRNQQVDKANREFWRRKPKMTRLGSSREFKTIRPFLLPLWPMLVLLLVASFFLAGLETSKSLAWVGVINSLTIPDDQVAHFLNDKILRGRFEAPGVIVNNGRVGLMIALFTGLGLLTLVSSLLTLFSSWLTAKARFRLIRLVRRAALNKILSFDLDYFSQARSGRLIFLMTAETSRFSLLISSVQQFFTAGLQGLLMLGLLTYLAWDLTLVVIAGGTAFFLLHLIIDARLKSLGWDVNLIGNQMSHLFHEIIYGVKMIKIGGLERRERDRYFQEHTKLEEQSIRLAVLQGMSGMAQQIASVILLLGAVGYVHLSGRISLGGISAEDLAAYLFVLTRTLPTWIGLQRARSAVLTAYGPLSRVAELLQRPDGPDRAKLNDPDLVGPKIHPQTISVRQVSHVYPGRDSALRDVDLTFKSSELIALVGFSGSGKSTLLDILSSVRRPTGGQVLIDGRPLTEEYAAAYRRAVGYVNQEPIIFHDTVRANLTYFNSRADENEIQRAVEMSAAAEFIDQLPHKLETGLGERGQSVSGGQRQRIGLARVLLADPPVLLLDEATNALDYETESLIYQTLHELKQGRIIIVAAHRLSAIRNFDRIIVLEQGRVVEQGGHEELTARHGVYFKLLAAQQKETGRE